MTDFAKVNLTIVYSENSDYSTPIATTRFTTFDLTPDEYRVFRLEVDTTDVVLDVSDFSEALTGVAIKNLDTSNYITVDWTSETTSNVQKIPADGLFFIPDMATTNLTLKAFTDPVEVDIFIMGT